MKKSRANSLYRLFAALALTATTVVASAESSPAAKEEPVNSASLDSEQTRNFEALLSEVVQNELKRQGRAHTFRSVRLDRKNNGVVVDLTREYLPRGLTHMTGELEERLHAITTAVDWIANFELKISIESTSYRFDGHELRYYYPEDFPDHDDASTGFNFDRLEGIGDIVVSAGHGKYLFHGNPPVWKFQRDPYFGVLEDQITQPLSGLLANLIMERGLHNAVQIRSKSTTVHAPSGSPWSDMATRYYLEALLPTRNDIWNSLAGASYPEREKDEDIRSRPLYANDITAPALLSIHTNGHTNPIPRGTRVYYHQGRIVPRQLATHVLCYMKEIINAQDGYEDFPVATSPHAATDNGENRIAKGPAIIVETAFHSNPIDAAALQDPVFQAAAMKGVEKGVRLYEEGEPCTPYEITDVPDVQGPWGSTQVISIYYEGFPQYPVLLEVELLSCPTICTPGGGVINDEIPSPIQVGLLCDGAPGSPVVVSTWRVHLKDDDGVKTEHDFTSTCGVGGVAAAESPNVPVSIEVEATRK